jgi:hypothetical protein
MAIELQILGDEKVRRLEDKGLAGSFLDFLSSHLLIFSSSYLPSST